MVIDQALAFVEELLKYLNEFKAADIVAMVSDFISKIVGGIMPL